MAEATVSPSLDHAAIAAGLGELKQGAGYSRVVVPDGKTLAYIKKGVLAVPAGLVKKTPKKLGSFTVEKNGKWANVAVDSTDKARAVLEYVVAQAGQS